MKKKKQNEELISIIVPLYNQEKYISECLDSLINQTYKNIEIIIVNDGSSDNSSKLVNKYKEKDNRIIFIDRKINKGTLYTRKEGFSICKGKYVTFVDSDDYLKINAIEYLYNLMLNKNVDFVITTLEYSNMKNNVEDTIINLKKDKSTFYHLLFETILLNSMCGGLYKRENLSDILNIKDNLIYAEDYLNNYYSFKKTNNILLINEKLYFYRYNNESITKTINREKIIKKISDITYVYSLIYDDLINDNAEQKYINKFSIRYMNYIARFSSDLCEDSNYKDFEKNINTVRKIIDYNICSKNVISLEQNMIKKKLIKNVLYRGEKKCYFYIKYIYNFLKRIKRIIKK